MGFNQAVLPAISEARFHTYQREADNPAHAWALYRWNLDLVAAFVPIVADVEVALRNTIHSGSPRTWDARTGGPATTSSSTTTPPRPSPRWCDATNARSPRAPSAPNKVIAELMLGTWVLLLGRGGTSRLGRAVDYETNLWRPTLRFGFTTHTDPGGRIRRPTRDAVHSRAALIRELRNRAVHHEPIFTGIRTPGTNNRVELSTVWSQAVELLGWINTELAAIHDDHGPPVALAARPRP